MTAPPAKIAVRDLNVYYGSHHALRGVNLDIPAGKVLALIGPSGCGKSTFLRCLNRMHDRSPEVRITGQILLDGQDIYAPSTDVVALRRRVGMVFQRPNPVPGSIYDNVALGPRLHGLARGRDLDRLVGDVLAAAGLWHEVRGRLHEPATSLSGGQQQRLCIARCLAVQPEVLLMDEPTSALDPAATAKIEDLVRELRGRYTVVLVTHNLQQAARVSDLTAFFLHGELVEVGPTGQIFTNPRDQRTEDYLTGKFG